MFGWKINTKIWKTNIEIRFLWFLLTVLILIFGSKLFNFEAENKQPGFTMV